VDDVTMSGLFQSLLAISVLVFPVASMLAIGLSYTLRQITGPLRHAGRVFRALVANFVIVPLLALGISRLLGLEPSLAAGLMLIATAAGAPFLIQLTQTANADTGLSATLLVLLMPVTVLYMPLVIPLVVTDASVSVSGIALPLISTLLLPLVAWVLLTAGAFAAGYLLSSPGFDRRTVMGLGAGQRNVAAALVVASQDFDDPNTLVMVVLCLMIELMILFPIAWMLRRRSPTRLPPPSQSGHVAH
jgi:BASS family bile acid:Na+ symporter